MTQLARQSQSRGRMLPWRSGLALAVGLWGLTCVTPAFAQEQLQRVLTVTGQGSEEVATSLTQVSLGVEVQADTAEEAQQEAARRADAVVNFLRSQSVSDLETTGLRLNPNYDSRQGQRRIVSYTASNTVQFELPTERAGVVVDAAVEAGATRINGISFIADDAALRAAQQAAIGNATDDAQQQAQAVLRRLNLNQQEIVGIQIDGASAPPPVFQRSEQALMSADAASSPIEGGNQTVEARVTLQIRY
jgi:uncharacterized protein YggE